jgi:hypothetical protein
MNFARPLAVGVALWAMVSWGQSPEKPKSSQNPECVKGCVTGAQTCVQGCQQPPKAPDSNPRIDIDCLKKCGETSAACIKKC